MKGDSDERGVTAPADGRCGGESPAPAAHPRSRRASAAYPFLLSLLLGAAAVAQEPLLAHPEQLLRPPSDWTPPSAADHAVDLPTGSRLFVAVDPTFPLVEIVIGLRGAAFLDPPGSPGLGRLTTEMLPRGGTLALDPDAFDERLDALGARIVSRFSPAFAVYGLSATRWDLEASVDLFVDALRRPRFDAERLADLTSNLSESLARRNDDPLDVLEREWEWLLYGHDHPSTRAFTPAVLSAADPAALAAHHRAMWRPADLVVAVSGDVTRQEAIAIATRLSAPLDGTTDAGALAWPPPAPGSGAGPGTYRLVRSADQAKVLLGHRLDAAAMETADRWPLVVLAEVLGGSGAVSRIQGRLRTAEGLVYRSSATIETGDLWPGELRIFFETRPDRVPRAVSLVLDEIERLRGRLVPLRELEAAKRNLLGQLRRRFDTADERAGYLAENALHGRPDLYWTDYAGGVAAVAAEDVLRVARSHLRPDALVALIVGPAPQGPEALEALFGRAVTRLPPRDPVTLEAVAPVAPGR